MRYRKYQDTYKPEIADKLEKYIDSCKTKKMIPWIEEFCDDERIVRMTFYNWCNATNEDDALLHPELESARSRLMGVQEMMIKTLGILGKANASMGIFVLKTDHNKIETEKIQHEGAPGGEPLTLIFTDSATFKRHKENAAKQE